MSVCGVRRVALAVGFECCSVRVGVGGGCVRSCESCLRGSNCGGC